jgi:hypothetical protein
VIAFSRNGIAIRLPDERWEHIIERHNVLADKQPLVLDTISNPDRILAGNEGALIALRELEPDRWLVVVYREDNRRWLCNHRISDSQNQRSQ